MNRSNKLLWAGLLFGGLLLIFSPLYTSPVEFVGDDVAYVTNNPLMNERLSLDLISRMLFAPYNFEYIPALFVSLRADVEIWGMSPAGFRMTNLFIFFLLGWATYALCVRFMPPGEGNTFRGISFAALAAAALVLLHPLNVETVAVATHRKELLYALFTVLALRHFADDQNGLRGTVLLLLFILLAQLSKGAAFVVPMILLFYEILYRRLGEGKDIRYMKLGLGFLVSWSIFLYQFRQAVKLVLNPQNNVLPAGMHLSGVAKGFALSLQHLLFPLNLSFEYALKWPDSLESGPHYLAALMVLAIIGSMAYRRDYKGLFFAAAILSAYFPYANIIRIRHGYSDFIVHYDHYLLTPLMLSALPIALVLKRFGQHRGNQAVWVLVLAACVTFAVQDLHISNYWKTRESLYTRGVAYAPAMGRPYYFLGGEYLEEEQYELAINILRQGLKVDPANMDLVLSLADAYAFSGDYPSALPMYERYIKFKPADEKALQNLTLTCMMLGRYDEAQEYLRKWLAVSPESPQALETGKMLKETMGN